MFHTWGGLHHGSVEAGPRPMFLREPGINSLNHTLAWNQLLHWKECNKLSALRANRIISGKKCFFSYLMNIGLMKLAKMTSSFNQPIQIPKRINNEMISVGKKNVGQKQPLIKSYTVLCEIMIHTYHLYDLVHRCERLKAYSWVNKKKPR